MVSFRVSQASKSVQVEQPEPGRFEFMSDHRRHPFEEFITQFLILLEQLKEDPGIYFEARDDG